MVGASLEDAFIIYASQLQRMNCKQLAAAPFFTLSHLSWMKYYLLLYLLL